MRRISLAVFIASALILTWPLATEIDTSVPLGSEASHTVPFLNVWTIGWNGMSLERGYQDYWDAPIFFPTPGAFAFSDPQPLTAIPAVILWDLSPALAYNIILLTYLVLNAVVTFLVLQQRGAAYSVSMIGALIMQALPFVTHERGVLQLQPIFAPIWAIGAMWAVLDRPSRLRGLNLGASIGVTFLTSEYYMLALAPVLVVALTWNLGRLNRPFLWTNLGIAALVTAGLILPIALPQAGYLNALGLERSEATLARTSAWLVDYLKPSSRLRVSKIAPQISGGSIQQLYPGLTIVVLAAWGFVQKWRRGEDRRWVGFLATTIIVALGISFGPHLRIGAFSPFLSLHQEIPFLRWTRSAFRFAAVAQMGLAFLAVIGLGWIQRRNPVPFFIVAFVGLMELSPLPERIVEIPASEPEWVAPIMTVELPVVAHLPWAQGRSARNYADTAAWMVQSISAGARLVNGYSGFFPSTNSEFREITQGFPSTASVEALQAIGVDYIILHDKLESDELKRLNAIVRAGSMIWLHSGSDGEVFQISGSEIMLISEIPSDR
jgi:hypothetical protein